MFLNNKKKFNKLFILNILLSFIPVSIVLGNLAINITISIICLTGLLVYGKEIFIVKRKIYGYLIYSFFIYLIIITFINNWSLIEKIQYKENLIKSLFYLRFLLLFLIINKLLESNEFNSKIFFYTCFFCSSIISIDVIFQFIFKVNLSGYPLIFNKPSSFFGEELVTGGYLQRFSLFSIFFIFLKFLQNKNENLFIILLFLIFLTPIILTGNRMPAMMMILSIALYFLIQKKIKELSIIAIIMLSLIFLLYKLPSENRSVINLKLFFNNSYNIITSAPKIFYDEKEKIDASTWSTGYLTHFVTGVDIWKKNKVFGHGLKSFKLNCSYVKYRNTCNTHPHNYFIELMVDVGIIGVVIIYFLVILGSISFIRSINNKINNNKKKISLIFFLLIFSEFFPFRSTGSFFTTGNSIFIFLLLPIFLNVRNLKNL